MAGSVGGWVVGFVGSVGGIVGSIGGVGFIGSVAGGTIGSVGGGIVADSDPAREYEETLHKAEGLLRSL